jgi:hypothetical protein
MENKNKKWNLSCLSRGRRGLENRPLMREGMRLMVNLARQQVALLPPLESDHQHSLTSIISMGLK